MFLRAKKFKRKKDNKARAYYYIVESEKKDGKVKQKVLMYLGNTESIYRNYKELKKLKKLPTSGRN